MRILLIAEHDNQHLRSATLHAYSALQALQWPVDVLLLGADCAGAQAEAQRLPGVAQVRSVCAAHLANPVAEDIAAEVLAIADEYHVLAVGATTFGKNFMPRVAARLGVPQVSDVVQILGNGRYVRPIYAGNVLATVAVQTPQQVLTIRPTAFPATALGAAVAPLEIRPAQAAFGRSRCVSVEYTASDRPTLDAAKIVVSGGRGLGSAEHFALVEALADALGGAVGASRAAVDSGYAPNDYQVGQTGKVVAPELYVAVGISGAIQHLAGMKDSRVIVAINKDAEAPIFQVADYGLVADLFQAVPELTVAVKA